MILIKEDIVKFESIIKAAKDCRKGVTWKASVQMFDVNILRWAASLERQLNEGTYKTKGFNNFAIHERGKLRKIQSVHISERCVQKSLCQNVMKPIITPKLIYDNSASLKNKGTDFALRRLRCHLERHYRKHGKKGGILIIDFSNYFGNISHAKLLSMLRECIKDDEVYKMCKDFIEIFDGEFGLGLGSEISQICAIYYPNKIDHYIKERLKIKGYGRYMDDSYLIHEDLDYLKKCLEQIRVECEKLDIKINEKRTKIVTFENESFEYLKKRIFISDTGKVVMRLTRKNITSERRKLKRHRILLNEGKISIAAINQSYQSWRGYAKNYDSYKTIKNMDNLYNELFGKEYK